MNIGNPDYHFIPSHLDDIPKMFLWDMDEAMAIMASLGLGILMHQIVVFTTIGFLLSYILAKVKARRGRGFLITLAYWYLPHNTLFKFKRYPPSFIRDYVG